MEQPQANTYKKTEIAGAYGTKTSIVGDPIYIQ
jgi:hypothetical protein